MVTVVSLSEKRLSLFQWQNIWKLPKLLDLRAPPPDVQLARICTVERNVGLPVKAAVLAVLVYYFFLSNWIKVMTSTSGGHSRVAPQERLLEFIPPILLGYIVLNGAFATLLIRMYHFSFRAIQRIVFANCLSDSIFLAALTLVTEGFKNPYLYWVFLVLIVRNTVSIPSAASQFTLNLGVSASYLLAGIADYIVQQKEALYYKMPVQLRPGDLEGVTSPWNEAFLLRLLLLVLVTICCYGVQVLLEKQRRANEEAQEYTLRQEQLQAAGRLAAEIAHQLKNPLGIINNAAYTLQKTVKEGKTITQQIRIIREEVERSDRIITELMGYARLSEGQVEKLDITEELDRAIDQVFPAAAKYDVVVKRDYGAALPAILAQRGHLSEAFVNILQNAREAMNGHGEIEVGARYGEDYSVEVSIKDNGPGISKEKLGKIFEAYFTTKEKGTGLGLAIVKHNTELYHGTVEVQSEPGKGACFIVRLPAKTVFTVRK